MTSTEARHRFFTNGHHIGRARLRQAFVVKSVTLDAFDAIWPQRDLTNSYF